MVSDITIHKAIKIHETLWTKHIGEIIILTIYQNYTLALTYMY